MGGLVGLYKDIKYFLPPQRFLSIILQKEWIPNKLFKTGFFFPTGKKNVAISSLDGAGTQERMVLIKKKKKM